MRRKHVQLLSVLLCVVFVALSPVLSDAQQKINEPDTFIKATTNSVETLNPQFMLSSATMELSFNVYDSLLDHPQGDYGVLIPGLATEVPSGENGLIEIQEDGTTTISFPIREGVQFHNGMVLTAEDVAYTFKRGLLAGAQTSNYNMLAQNLLGAASFKDLADKIGFDGAYDLLEQRITVDGNKAIFVLPKPFVPFLGIMGDGGAGMGIMSKAWCIEQGAWPGSKETAQEHMGLTAEDDQLFDKMMGTGPFKFVSWERSERVVLERFDDYWQGPAKLQRVIRKIIADIPAGILLLKQGDVDFVSVNVDQLVQVEGAPGVKVMKNLPSSWLMKINMVFDIAEGSKYIGDGQLGEKGIPKNFFSDINVRKAFQHSFDWDVFIEDVFLGAALKPYGPVLIGFPTANKDNPQYALDLEKAEEYFKKAWDGQVWEKGFSFTVLYSSGSTHRQRALEILKMNIESLNPKFRIELASLPWASYVGAIKEKQLPLTLFGILPDVIDPYLPLFEHLHSAGGYAEWGGYIDMAKKKYDSMINELGSNYDPERRKELSYELQRLAYEDSQAIFHFQAVQHVAMRDWVQGYYVGPFPFNVDFYPLEKANK
jgi:peptide/nickel transport system substrate-binding protein